MSRARDAVPSARWSAARRWAAGGRALHAGAAGQGLVEYALILTFVSLVAAAALLPIGTWLVDALGTVTGSFPAP